MVSMGKRGKFSEEEINFVKQNAHEKSIEDLARYLDRNPKTIKKLVDSLNLSHRDMSPDEYDKVSLKNRLYSKEYWPEVNRQFTPGEIDYFVAIWIQLIQQFREDVLPTEELQIKQLITTEILMNRCMVERKRNLEEVERLDSILIEEYARPLGERNTDRIMNLEQQMSLVRGAQSTHTTEYTKLSKEYKDLAKDLKATRDQRLQRIEDGKTSWIGLIRMLEDEIMREREGLDMEIMSASADKSLQELGEYHTYDDGTVDRPMLTPEIVLEKDDEE
tara:strand:+ start:755 stop:1582 length:828 start_codon:yes stop_codon:yes gene_type:complete